MKKGKIYGLVVKSNANSSYEERDIEFFCDVNEAIDMFNKHKKGFYDSFVKNDRLKISKDEKHEDDSCLIYTLEADVIKPGLFDKHSVHVYIYLYSINDRSAINI